MIELPKHSDLLKLPEQLYGKIKKVGVLNNEPILYGDVNLLRQGDLFYFASAHQIYRYVGTRRNNAAQPIQPGIGIENPIGGGVLDPIEPQVVEYQTSYIFEEVEPMLDGFMSNGLTIPDEQRGTIKRTGKLFDKIIYSGDPNFVKNGNLYYHEAFPLISTVGINDGVITLSADWIGMYGNISTMNVEYRVSPIPHDYSQDYLTFEALEDGTFTLTIPVNINSTYMTSVSYSTDNGTTWVTTQVDNTKQTITTPTITAGNKVLWKGVGKSMTRDTFNYSSFSATGNYIVNGNVMSLLYGDEFANQVTFQSDTTYNFANLFYNTTKLISASNMVLPATTLVNNCYNGMFYGCTALTTAPSILPATTLKQSCYNTMFSGCTSLTTAPELPATTLAEWCYNYMFYGCTSLTKAPALPATTLVRSCYNNMFQNCSSLNYIKAMFTTTPGDSYTSNWVKGVAESGTFVKNSAATWNVTGNSGIPTGWTVETADA